MCSLVDESSLSVLDVEVTYIRNIGGVLAHEFHLWECEAAATIERSVLGEIIGGYISVLLTTGLPQYSMVRALQRACEG